MRVFIERAQHLFETPFSSYVLVFSVILFVILLAPLIFRLVKIPGIIGLIISGLIIGPHGLGWIEKNAAVDLFSTIGLLYIMFIAGLELNLSEFKNNRHKSLVFGFFTFVLPFVIGYPVCRYLLGFEFSTSFLVASMFSTHTLVAYPIVSRMGIANHEAVAITVGGTIFTDTAVLIILAIITGSVAGEITPQFWLMFFVSVVIFLLVVFLIIPRLTAWFFKNLEGEKRSHFIFVLSMVFFSAFLSELAGLEPIIGAFAAGIAMNRLIPKTSSLMNRLEFVGNSLFIPFFLLSVGMLINLEVLNRGPFALIVAGTLTVVALIGKFAAAWATSLIFGYQSVLRKLIFGLSSAHAAATLAVIMVGFRIGIVDESVLNGTILLILVTCLVASFVTDRAAKELMITKNDTADSELMVLREQKILVPISNPQTMDKLIDLAIAIKNPRNKFPIVGLSVVEDGETAQRKLLEAKKMLEKAMIHASATDQKVEIITTIDQKVTSRIRRVAKEIFATEILIGFSLKNQFADFIFGNTIKYIVDNTSQAVWVSSVVSELHHHKRIVVMCPRYADREFGFKQWLSRVFRLSSALHLECLFLSTPQTFRHVKEFHAKRRASARIKHTEFTEWDEFEKVESLISPMDLIVIAMPRKGTVSYIPTLENIPRIMSKEFENFSFILIYPTEAEDSSELLFSNDFSQNIVDKGLEQLSQVLKRKEPTGKTDS